MQNRAKDFSRFTTLLDFAIHWAKVIPHREAFVFRRQDSTRYSLTWSNYLHLGTQFAARLQKMGIVKGDVICNYLVNSPERVVTELGTMMAGAVPMHGETLFADKADVIEILNKANVRAVILDPEHNKDALQVFETHFSFSQRKNGNPSGDLDFKHIIYSQRNHLGKLLLFDDLETSAELLTAVPVDQEDIAYIFPTSGSTGFSKLVPHTHGSLVHFVQMAVTTGFVTARGRFFSDFSFGWSPGSIGMPIITGSTRVSTDFRSGHQLDYTAFVWEGIVEEMCQVAILMASDIHNICQRKELWNKKGFTLDTISTGGQPIHRGIFDAVGPENGWARKLVVNYGSTETWLVSNVLFYDASEFEEYLAGDIICHPVKIVDNRLEEVPCGAQGEILVKASYAFKGYLRDPEINKTVFTDDGWIRTNDLGYLDDRGRLFVLGRRSDAIMKGLSVVFPSWLETRIRQCPGVADVVVVPIPDEVLHHEICACVVRKHGYDVTESDLDSFCQDRFVSGLKETEAISPKYFLFFDSFPLNANNKTDRQRIKQEAAKWVANTKQQC